MSGAANRVTSAIWSKSSAEDLERFTRVARHALGVPVACVIDDLGQEACLPSWSMDQAGGWQAGGSQAGGPITQFENRLTVDLTSPSAGAVYGAMVVADVAAREWSDHDRAVLRDIADSLTVLLAARHDAIVAATRHSDLRGDMSSVPAPNRGRTLTLVDGNHDLRTSLQGIVGLTELLKKETQPETIVTHALTIQSAAEALLSLVSESQVANGQVQGSGVDTTSAHDDDRSEGAHILLADDLDLNRKLICDMLSLEGHVVDSVADGASAVKAAGEHAYDLILMDMIMPGMDGVAATRAIRALPSPACEVPIVALTAHSLPEQLDSCLQAGMDATLTKPMTMDALNGAVATWTRRRRKAA